MPLSTLPISSSAPPGRSSLGKPATVRHACCQLIVLSELRTLEPDNLDYADIAVLDVGSEVRLLRR